MYFLNAAANFISHHSENLWSNRKLLDYASDKHKLHDEFHDHKESDWLTANKRLIETLTPITQFIIVVIGEHFILDSGD